MGCYTKLPKFRGSKNLMPLQIPRYFPEKLLVARFFSHFPLKRPHPSSWGNGKHVNFLGGGDFHRVSTGCPNRPFWGPGASAASSLRAPRWLASQRCRTTSGRATGSRIRMMPRGQGAQLKTDQTGRIGVSWLRINDLFSQLYKLPVKWSNKAIRGGLLSTKPDRCMKFFRFEWTKVEWLTDWPHFFVCSCLMLVVISNKESSRFIGFSGDYDE